MIFYNNNHPPNYRCKNWNVRPINCSYNVRNSMKSLKFLGQNPQTSWIWKLHKSPLQMTLTNLQKILTISEIILSATPYTSPTLHKVFPVPSLCNDIAIILSTKIVSLIRVYGPNLSHRNLNVLWHTWDLCLNIFSKKKRTSICS